MTLSRLPALVMTLLLAVAAVGTVAATRADAQGGGAIPPASAGPAPTASAPVAAPAAAAATGGAASLTDGYVLGPGDILEIGVIGRQDYQARVQVQIDGTIQLPLINDVAAANRTVLQLRSEIKAKLVAGGYFTDTAAVAVNIASYASRYITVLGEVGQPGLVPIDRAYHLSEIIARVGGTKPSASDDIVLTHADGGTQTLNLVQVATGSDAQNPLVTPGDRIFIATAPQYYIYGQVNAPGSYRIDRGMSLRMALARGGGLTSQGSERRIKLIRNGEELRGVDPNAPIQPGDTIVVGERFF